MFDAVAYANANPDLKAAYGNDLNALYHHFITTESMKADSKEWSLITGAIVR